MKTLRPPDPRCAFALAAYFSLFAVLVQTLPIMGALLVLSGLSGASMGAGFHKVFSQLRRFWQIVLIIALLQSLFSPSGVVWLKVGPLILLTSGGMETGLVVLARLAILILSGALFTIYSTRELIHGMIRMKLPYEIAYMVSVGIRFIPMMGEELRDSLTALALRGIVAEELSLKQRLKMYIYLLLPVVAGSLHNARELAMSLEMRGFGAYEKRTSYYDLTLNRRDYVWLTLTALMAVLTGGILYFFG